MDLYRVSVHALQESRPAQASLNMAGVAGLGVFRVSSDAQAERDAKTEVATGVGVGGAGTHTSPSGISDQFSRIKKLEKLLKRH